MTTVFRARLTVIDLRFYVTHTTQHKQMEIITDKEYKEYKEQLDQENYQKYQNKFRQWGQNMGS